VEELAMINEPQVLQWLRLIDDRLRLLDDRLRLIDERLKAHQHGGEHASAQQAAGGADTHSGRGLNNLGDGG